ncbi:MULTISPECIES: hypothetical protein [unclassified Clostridium]|uniref:hypothetical protein n=1 Tax=unclassified Clostridium TaxID=2614128 RepID=UPI0002978B19|nr:MULTISPECIES: hypothetical protein [unclassified Clostridium]EKQ56274.1 MAG: hypothetical protein A370_02030 [Clostridium sp. Maddingley MBC34-26]
MLVYSTKTVKCKGDSENVVISCYQSKEVPDWVAKTEDFKAAINDGCMSILKNRKQKSAAENGDLDK